MLALAGTLRPRAAPTVASTTSGPAHPASLLTRTDPYATCTQPASSVPSSALLRYQSVLADLQHKISTLHHTVQASNDDIVELLGSVLVLVSTGFPSSSGSPAKGADWALHISGHWEIAAHLEIGAFSLGSVEYKRRNGRFAWLEWGIAPPDATAATQGIEDGFSPTEVMMRYPRPLVTITAALSAVLECQDRGGEDVDPLVHETIMRLYERACAGTDYYLPSPTGRYNHDNPALTEVLLSKLETVLTQWKYPPIPPHLSTQLTLALTTAWEIMRKAALIFSWRRGFLTSVLKPLPSARAGTALKFVHEMLVGLHALLNMYDEQRINSCIETQSPAPFNVEPVLRARVAVDAGLTITVTPEAHLTGYVEGNLTFEAHADYDTDSNEIAYSFGSFFYYNLGYKAVAQIFGFTDWTTSTFGRRTGFARWSSHLRAHRREVLAREIGM
ncbi:hypothetical protein BJX63DRAFT_431584 [Aspergillus granulosus]|uniref:Uncharacterized protein n=1 Tax=Aspergillus granulosus TaxID=176169 RepID=A0ABR4HG97_9EURO